MAVPVLSNFGNRRTRSDEVQEVLYAFQTLMAPQRIWATEWQEISDYVRPRKNSILVQRIAGSKRTQKLYDSTASDASELLANSMHGTLTSAHMRWFFLKFEDPYLNDSFNAKTWLEQVTDKINSEINKSNFHSEVQEHYDDMVVFGTACLFCSQFPKRGGKYNGLNFTSVPIGKYAIAEGPDGRANAIYRSFPLRFQAIKTRWPDADYDMLTSAKNETMFEIIHAVYPVEQKSRLDWKWKSMYILYQSRTLLQSKGFYQFPFMVSRWSKNNDEYYGHGPTHTAIPDVRSLNKIVELELKATAKVVDPPMGQVSGDVIGTARLVPGGVTTVRNKEALFPIETGINFQVNNLKKEELRAAIKGVYKVDLLQLPTNGPQMTATESQLRYELMQRILGPALGRIEIEFTHPLIDWCFETLRKEKVLPPPPPEVLAVARQKKVTLAIQYEGPLARAQKSSDADAIDKLTMGVMQLAQANPDILDVIDFDEAVRQKARILSVPSAMIRDKDQVEALRQAKEQQMQAQQDQQQGAAQAQAAGQAAPLLKAAGKAPEPNSPLEQMQNNAGQQAA